MESLTCLYFLGKGLYKFVVDSLPSPKSELDDGTPSLDYDTWLHQDQLVMYALISSLFEPLIS